MSQTRDENQEKVTRDAVWRLVIARCTALTEVISSARVPLIIALTWSLAWIWSLFSSELGFTKLYYDRMLKMHTLMESNKDGFERLCTERLIPSKINVGGQQAELTKGNKMELCTKLVKERLQIAHSDLMTARYVSLPGGVGRLHRADLGILGNFGFLMFLTWAFFSMRRENYSMRTFVDYDRNTSEGNFMPPRIFVLRPQDDMISPQHYCYAYQAISQRFLFILAKHSSQLFFVTALLLCVPLCASLLNLFVNTRAMMRLGDIFEMEIWVRFIAEVVLSVIVLRLTLSIIKLTADTSRLLAGWYLAVEKVWIREWNEKDLKAASSVFVNLDANTAIRYDEDHDVGKNSE